MKLTIEKRQHFAIRRKGLIHIAALALLTALLACNAGATSSPTATETTVPETVNEEAATATATATATEESGSSGDSGNSASEPTDPTVRTTAELNVRYGPNTNCAQLGSYPNNTDVKVLAKDPSGTWWQVPYGNGVGWMSAAYTTPVNDLSSVQVIPGPACQAPPTATSTATATNTSNPPTATATITATSTATSGKDHSTHQMAVTILNEELEHENDIEDWLADIQRMKDEFKKIRM